MLNQPVFQSDGVMLRLASQRDCAAVTALQQAAYAPNRVVLGVEPLPLLANYDEIIADMEVWLAHCGDVLQGVLVLQPGQHDLLIWSVATSPTSRSDGLGNRLLAKAEARARELSLGRLVLYTGSLLTERIAWYQRKGFKIDREEQRSDRCITHMSKFVTGSVDFEG